MLDDAKTWVWTMGGDSECFQSQWSCTTDLVLVRLYLNWLWIYLSVTFKERCLGACYLISITSYCFSGVLLLFVSFPYFFDFYHQLLLQYLIILFLFVAIASFHCFLNQCFFEKTSLPFQRQGQGMCSLYPPQTPLVGTHWVCCLYIVQNR